MKAASSLWLLILSQFWTTYGREEVRFGNRLYTVVNAADCPDSNYDDPKNTGSYLLNKEYPNDGQMTLSTDIQLVHYMAKPYKCFRAHPVFVDCMQSALSKLKTIGKRALVVGGYRPPAVVGSSTAEEDVFAAAGTALELLPQSNDPDDLPVIVQHVLRYCPAKLERIHRNLGIVIKASRMHVFMGGPTDPPVFRLDGFPSASLPGASQDAFINDAVTEGLELGKRASNCLRFTPLTSGQMFPLDAVSAEGTVGKMDIPVLRNNIVDFTRMVQYLGSDVKFDNNERTAAWCGDTTTQCVDCRTGQVDATLGGRCTARMMTPRMSDFLTLLQKLTAETLSDSVRVMQAWEEDYENHVASPSSLHREGRALLVKLDSGNSGNLGTVSQLAICAEADFVQHNGDHLLIAMQKQHGDEASEVEFPQATMVRADPPSSKDYLFSLPANFTESDHAEYPILDSSGKETLQLAAHTTAGQFLSSQTRYFRMNPFVVDCYSRLQDYFAKREDTDGPVTLEVVRGFMTTPERDVSFTINDHRYVSSILGLSFEILPITTLSSGNVGLPTLARLAVTQCTPIFQENEQQIGVGLYPDRVYVDMRDTFLFWNPAGSFSSHVKSAAEFKAYLADLFEAAYDSRVIEPDSPSEAEVLAEPTYRQSVTYRYATPERILRSRADTTVDLGECVPNSNTEFCQRSQPFRLGLVNKGWREAAKKHNNHDPQEVKEAFEQCFSACGTCLSGAVYEAKLEHCSNFMHWSPFEMAPDGTTINLFPRERAAMRRCACQGGSHCIEDSALFLLLVNMFEAKFRPDPLNSVEEDVYPQTDNPSPVAELLNQLYATHHEGVAKVWIHDDNDITSMRGTLEQLMVYNPNVTEVKIYVNETSTKDAVDSVLRNLIMEWTTSTSPLFTREYVAPYTLFDLQDHCRITSKRATQQHNVRDEMIAKMHDQEDRYLGFDL